MTDVAREIGGPPDRRRPARAHGSAARLDSRGRRALAGRRRAPRPPARPRRSRSSAAGRPPTPRSSPAPSGCPPSSASPVSASRFRPNGPSSSTATAVSSSTNPSKEQHPKEHRSDSRSPREERAASGAGRPGRPSTRDGLRIAVRANLELPEEIPALERFRAEGIGLFRSEFLYLRALPQSPRRRRAATGLRDAAGGRGAAPGRRADLRPRRREGDRAGPRREPGPRPARPPLLPGASRSSSTSSSRRCAWRRGRESCGSSCPW